MLCDILFKNRRFVICVDNCAFIVILILIAIVSVIVVVVVVVVIVVVIVIVIVIVCRSVPQCAACKQRY